MANVTVLRQNNTPTFSDITNNFIKNPVTDEVVLLFDDDDVTQAIQNLILTTPGERLFNPYFGSGVSGSVFEPMSPFLIEDLVFNITLSIQSFEPRITLFNVAVVDDTDNDQLAITITFSILNKAASTSTLYIRRVR